MYMFIFVSISTYVQYIQRYTTYTEEYFTVKTPFLYEFIDSALTKTGSYISQLLEFSWTVDWEGDDIFKKKILNKQSQYHTDN